MLEQLKAHVKNVFHESNSNLLPHSRPIYFVQSYLQNQSARASSLLKVQSSFFLNLKVQSSTLSHNSKCNLLRPQRLQFSCLPHNIKSKVQSLAFLDCRYGSIPALEPGSNLSENNQAYHHHHHHQVLFLFLFFWFPLEH